MSQPERPDTIPLARPEVGAAELEAVGAVLDSGYLVQGPRVAAFERRLAAHLEMPHAVAVTSGTAALHLAMLGCELAPRDEVVVPAFGFPATANAVEIAGGRAVLADVDAGTCALTAASVEAVATAHTVGVVVVHAFGIPAPMEELEALCAQRGWWLVEDAACALGTEPRGRWCRGPHPVCLSFHPRKLVTTGEGGAVLTADEALAERLQRLRNHGIGPARDEARPWERFHEAGFNYRLSDVHAAIGLVQLERLGAAVERRRVVADWYRDALPAVPWAALLAGYDQEALSFQSLVVVLDDPLDRDAISRALAGRGVETTLAGYSLAHQPYYRQRYALDPAAFPTTSRLFSQALTLPLWCDMTRDTVARVVAALRASGEVSR